MHAPRTLVVIPTYNERENIGSLISRILSLYPQVDVLVVDDASKDGTANQVTQLQATHGDRIQLLSRIGKNGRGSAVLEGFAKALQGPYELICEMDADFSHRPEEIALFFPMMQQYDCVIGSRYVPGSEIREWGWKRTLFSHWANAFARAVLRIPMHDYTNGFRCYTREAVAAIDMARIDAKGYVVLSEVSYQLHRKKFRIGEVPTLFVNRRRGASNLGFHEINEAFFSVLRIRWPWMSRTAANIGTLILRGSLSAVIDLLALFLLVSVAGISPLPSFALASVIATAAMFSLRRQRWGAHADLPVGMFLFLYGTVGVFSVLCAALLLHAGVSYLFSKALAIILATPLSYVLGRRLLPSS